MVDTLHLSSSTRRQDHAAQAISVLMEGISGLIEDFRALPETRKLPFIIELEQMHGFLHSFQLMYESMPENIVRHTILNTIRTIAKHWDNLPKVLIGKLKKIQINANSQFPVFIHEAVTMIGPEIRLCQNEMKAWIKIDNRLSKFYHPTEMNNILQKNGICVGIMESAIKNLFDNEIFDEEVLIAEGILPTPGQNGRIEYCINVDDLGKAPKQLENGKVSYKDIQLFAYASKGERLANIFPPVPGKTGYTVTRKPVHSIEVYEAVIPKLRYAELSEDGLSITVTEDSCVTKKFGFINLEPTVRVEGSVSFASGNIDSSVSVLVTEGVNSGFSIHSKKDVVIHGIVEGAEIHSEGDINIKGGIQGKGKAQIYAGGEIHTKLISNATVTCIGDLHVANEILNSTVISDGKVILSQSPAQITGGEIQADTEIIADVIGSDIGVSTAINLGGKTEELQRLLRETEQEINEQESRLDTCQQLIQNLEMQLSSSADSIEGIEKACTKAKQMLSAIQERLDVLYQEQEDLIVQLEDNAVQSRSVIAKKKFWNGTKIIISGVELEIQEPTGPAIAVLSGEEITILPYTGKS